MPFTESQSRAIRHTVGNLQLIACAGSGKTEVVAQRVVTLLRSTEQGGGGCGPSNIVAFTFTDKAAAELKERIHTRCREQLGAVTGLAEMYVGTIHGYCLEFSEKAIEIALGDGVSVAGRIDLVKRVDTGEVTIVDLKSNDRAQTEAVTETQLHIYALGYQELTGRDADYVEIYELDEQKQKRRSVDSDFIADVKRDVRKAADALRRNTLPPQPSQKACGSCDYCRLCSAAVAKP